MGRVRPERAEQDEAPNARALTCWTVRHKAVIMTPNRTRQIANAATRGQARSSGPRLWRWKRGTPMAKMMRNCVDDTAKRGSALPTMISGEVALLARRRSQVFQPYSTKNAKLVIPTM